MEENNNNIVNKIADIKRFSPIHAAFQITRKIMLFVDYNVREDNTRYFATSAAVFNQPKTNYNRCGQCQESVLPHNSLAYRFFKEWDKHHLSDLTETQYNILLMDISVLQTKYNSVILGEPYEYVPFNQAKKLSMMKLKKQQ